MKYSDEAVKRHSITVGSYIHHTTCRFCLGKQLSCVADFGLVPLAGGFFPPESGEKEFSEEVYFPLALYFCHSCFLLQLIDIVDANTLFRKYLYMTAAIPSFQIHFRQLAEELRNKYYAYPFRTIVEIGCNDGTLLQYLQSHGFRIIGVDPAKNIVAPLVSQGLPIINDFFTASVAKKILRKQGKADIIVSCNSFAHIDTMHDVMKGIDLLLSKEGIIIIEAHYAGIMVKELQYDVIYHEHHNYYSLITLDKFFEQYDMEIFDAKILPTYGGSMRFYIKRKGMSRIQISPNTQRIRQRERNGGLDKVTTYRQFYRHIKQNKQLLVKTLSALKRQKKRVVGYGASGKATIISAYCGISASYLDCILDDAPAKQKWYTPYNHLPIYSSRLLDRKSSPQYCLLFAWAYADSIAQKHIAFLQRGGVFIVPFPELRILRLVNNRITSTVVNKTTSLK